MKKRIMYHFIIKVNLRLSKIKQKKSPLISQEALTFKLVV